MSRCFDRSWRRPLDSLFHGASFANPCCPDYGLENTRSSGRKRDVLLRFVDVPRSSRMVYKENRMVEVKREKTGDSRDRITRLSARAARETSLFSIHARSVSTDLSKLSSVHVCSENRKDRNGRKFFGSVPETCPIEGSVTSYAEGSWNCEKKRSRLRLCETRIPRLTVARIPRYALSALKVE